MEIIFELLFQLFGELILQVVFEVLAELGLHSFRSEKRKRLSLWWAIPGYIIFGFLAGILSLIIFPNLFLTSRALQLVGVILLPVLAGFVMALLGAWRRRREQELIRLDRFAFGYLFALAMALVRFWFGDQPY